MLTFQKSKNILIMGVSNSRSIAWASVLLLEKEHNVIVSYHSERSKRNILKLVNENGLSIDLVKCDVTNEEDIDSLIEHIFKVHGHLDSIIHSLAYIPYEELQKKTVEISREGFLEAMNISVYSLISICNKSKDILRKGGSIVTLTYIGSDRVVEEYSIMGAVKAALNNVVKYLAHELGTSHEIRVNAVSAGPIDTLSARGIKNFHIRENNFKNKNVFNKSIDNSEISEVIYFLLSEKSSLISGQIINSDYGFSNIL